MVDFKFPPSVRTIANIGSRIFSGASSAGHFVGAGYEGGTRRIRDALDKSGITLEELRRRAGPRGADIIAQALEQEREAMVAEEADRELSERMSMAGGDIQNFRIVSFYRGVDPDGFSLDPKRVPEFTKPQSIIKKNTKATLVIEDPGYINGARYTQEFILTRMVREATERYQLTATFGGAGYDLIMFGSEPMMMTCQGHVLNGAFYNTQWHNRFLELYDSTLKGSEVARNKRRIFLFYGDRVVEGVILKASFSEDASPGSIVDFSWVMLLVNDWATGSPTVMTKEAEGSAIAGLGDPTLANASPDAETTGEQLFGGSFTPNLPGSENTMIA